jgi:hypothetical protein
MPPPAQPTLEETVPVRIPLRKSTDVIQNGSTAVNVLAHPSLMIGRQLEMMNVLIGRIPLIGIYLICKLMTNEEMIGMEKVMSKPTSMRSNQRQAKTSDLLPRKITAFLLRLSDNSSILVDPLTPTF